MLVEELKERGDAGEGSWEAPCATPGRAKGDDTNLKSRQEYVKTFCKTHDIIKHNNYGI